MTSPEISRLSAEERLDLIGALCQSLIAEHVNLTPEQADRLARQVAELEFANDDLDWAKPFIQEGVAEADRGEGVGLAEHEARMDALMAKLSAA